MKMFKFIFLLPLLATLFCSCSMAKPEGPHKVYVQIQLPKDFDTNAERLGSVEAVGMFISSSPIKLKDLNKESKTVSKDFLVYPDAETYIVLKLEKQLTRVYKLEVPADVENEKWSDWVSPTWETQASDFSMRKVHGRSLDLKKPVNLNAYKMRLRYEKWVSPSATE